MPTDTGADKDSDFDVEDILSRRTIGTIDTDSRERAGGATGVKFDEVATGTIEAGVLLLALHGVLGHGSDDGRASTDAFTEPTGPVTDLTDVHRDVGVLRSGSDSELMASILSA